jgi:hypothetical protein
MSVSKSWIDATPERMDHARRGDRLTPLQQIHFPNGMPSGEARREIYSLLRSLRERDEITDTEEQAGEYYCLLSRRAGHHARVTMRWTLFIDGTPSPPDTLALREHAALEFSRATRFVHPAGRPALRWLLANEMEDISLANLGAQYPGGGGYGKARERGILFARLALVDLGLYFGYASAVDALCIRELIYKHMMLRFHVKPKR